MRKSLVVKLVLLNSALALSGCHKTCEDVDRKDDLKAPDQRAEPVSCRGGSSGVGHHGSGIWLWRGSRTGGAYGPRTTGSVTRGGFGATGHVAS